jgi:hypothetical protein
MKEHQQKIFDKVLLEWEKRVGRGRVDERMLEEIILLADTNGDGKKRVSVCGKTFLVPIDDIILNGLTGRKATGYPEAPMEGCV